MGSDDLFHKRKTRRVEDLARRKAKRSAYSKVLIVCEGEKTEPFYFEDLKSYYELNSANIEITGDCGSAPINIFEHASQRYREEDRAGDPFDKVYCVFDKDQHDTYDAAMERIRTAELPGVFIAINSERALTAAQQSHTDNPSTLVHELVEFLQHIKEQDTGE